MFQTKIPKDIKGSNKFIFGLSIKQLFIIAAAFLFDYFMFRSLFSVIWLMALLIIIVDSLLAFALFYKTRNGDDFLTYVFNLSSFYFKPKYLVYKKRKED